MDFANIIYTIFKKEADKSTANMNGLDIHYKFNDNSSVNGNVYSDINSSILSELMNHNDSMEIVSAKVDGYEIKDILLTVGVAINIL